MKTIFTIDGTNFTEIDGLHLFRKGDIVCPADYSQEYEVHRKPFLRLNESMTAWIVPIKPV